ncbi:MAG: tRNA (N(6)-L-threonylcarbamoyladenosine(37)-C(2))-methylthiotransferase MtaB [Deltaproteobacteria bacterium]|nr:tRNA (N(6)-L-threonylcarbamoyladenosine(37)-C(2))-methylthiotransferase MtaB [Deltaproteobacteria bacterium]
MKTVSIATLGCKVNQFESEALMADLAKRGYRLVPFGNGADITIINTCTVTHRADFDSRQMVRKALRKNPGSFIIVTGCYSRVAPETFSEMEGVRYLLGNREKGQIPDLLPLMDKGRLPTIQISDIQREKIFLETPVHTFRRHTRAFLKIQDGCNGRCSYCIVPLARGPSRSLPPEKVVEHLRILKERGFKEVVLTGIHTGSYGSDLQPPFSLEKLLQRIEMEDTPSRIRLSSIEPLDFSPGLISILSQSKKICSHLHIPIQSGDDDVLKRMNRNYDRFLLKGLIQELHRCISEISIGADVIVGFPGETKEQFENSYQLIESLPISYLHVFPFSKRKGTAAAQMNQQANAREIRQRAEVMRELGRQKRRSFYSRFLHQELNVLIEDRREKKSGRWRGLSRNYIPVLLSDGEGLTLDNQELNVLILESNDREVIGRVVEDFHG